MTKGTTTSIRQHFSDLTDPRRRETSYPLMDMVIMALSAVICGADDFVAIAKFVHSKKEWFGTFLDMSKGVPSHDRFNAVFAALRPAEFEKCLLSWITSLHAVTGGQVIAIDGKTLRRSYDKASSKSAIHMVSAWATMNHISLGQVVTDEKSNEITAIPKLLQLIEINGALITIDAMGCQTEIAATIVDLKANYCLAVKRNQPTLHDGIGAHFSKYLDNDFENTKVRRHVSRDTRTRARSGPLQFHLSAAERSSGPKSLERTEGDRCRRVDLAAEWQGTHGVRYYILSRYLSGPDFANAVVARLVIENNLHWQLDVTSGEDQCRLRKGHSNANFSILRRTALSLLKNESTAKVGIKNKRLMAGWNEDYLSKVLFK